MGEWIDAERRRADDADVDVTGTAKSPCLVSVKRGKLIERNKVALDLVVDSIGERQEQLPDVKSVIIL